MTPCSAVIVLLLVIKAPNVQGVYLLSLVHGFPAGARHPLLLSLHESILNGSLAQTISLFAPRLNMSNSSLCTIFSPHSNPISRFNPPSHQHHHWFLNFLPCLSGGWPSSAPAKSTGAIDNVGPDCDCETPDSEHNLNPQP